MTTRSCCAERLRAEEDLLRVAPRLEEHVEQQPERGRELRERVHQQLDALVGHDAAEVADDEAALEAEGAAKRGDLHRTEELDVGAERDDEDWLPPPPGARPDARALLVQAGEAGGRRPARGADAGDEDVAHRLAQAEGGGALARFGPPVAEDVLGRVREHPRPPGPRRGPGVQDGQAAGVVLGEDELRTEAREQAPEAAVPRRAPRARSAHLEPVQRVRGALGEDGRRPWLRPSTRGTRAGAAMCTSHPGSRPSTS